MRKTAFDTAGSARHTLYVYASLELRSTSFTDTVGDDERDGTTERPDLLVGGARLARVVPGDGLPSLTPGSPPHVFLTVGDHLGSTAVVVDLATSELVEQNGYEAYGGAESALRPGRWQSQREPYRFTGKEDDLAVGLQYFGARYDAPLLGRCYPPKPRRSGPPPRTVRRSSVKACSGTCPKRSPAKTSRLATESGPPGRPPTGV